MKYVIFNNNGLTLNSVIFDEALNHVDFRPLETETNKIVSAGYCHVLQNAIAVDLRRNGSLSLGIETFNLGVDEMVLNECQMGHNLLRNNLASEYAARTIDKSRLFPGITMFNQEITKLKPKQIFVFGSNTEGQHFGGAAAMAYRNFGAEWGVAEGMTGKTYAIPTMEPGGKQVTDEALFESFKKFLITVLQYQRIDPDMRFLLTPVGCGIAGWKPEKVTFLLQEALKQVGGEKYCHGIQIPNNLCVHTQLVAEWNYIVA